LASNDEVSWSSKTLYWIDWLSWTCMLCGENVLDAILIG
jgi:hypothetical protein